MHLFQKLLLVCLLCPLQLLAKEDPRVRVRFETSLGKFTVELQRPANAWAKEGQAIPYPQRFVCRATSTNAAHWLPLAKATT